MTVKAPDRLMGIICYLMGIALYLHEDVGAAVVCVLLGYDIITRFHCEKM